MEAEPKGGLGSERLLELLLASVARQEKTSTINPIELAIIGIGIAICMGLEDIARQLLPKGPKEARELLDKWVAEDAAASSRK